MTVRVYRWDDAGAPTLSSTIGSLINVLDACLVTGYGAQAPLGWTKPFADTNVAVFRAGAGNQRYLRVLDSSTGTVGARVVGYEDMTDANTGSGAFPTEAQVVGGLYVRKSSSTTTSLLRAWILIGDAKRFYLIVDRNTADFTSTTAGSFQGMFFGDIISFRPDDTYGTALIAQESTTTSVGRLGNVTTSVATVLNGHFLCRDYSQTGTSVASNLVSDARGSNTNPGADGVPFPDPVTGGILLAPLYVCGPTNKVTRGRLPGVWNPLHPLPGANLDTFTGKVGTPLEGKTFMLVNVDGTSTAAGTTTRSGRMAFEISDTWE